MRNSRFKYTAVAALLLAFTTTVPAAAVWPDDLEPETGPTSITVQQEPANPSATTSTTSEAQFKKIIENTQVKLDQLRTAAGFPGATVGFVLPDGLSGSVSTGVSDLATKRPLVPTEKNDC